MLERLINEFCYTQDKWVWELIATIASTVYVILAMRQSVLCWPFGVVGAIFYVYVFFSSKLYALTFEYGVYFVLCLYGWFIWGRGDRQGHGLPVRSVRRLEGSSLLALGLVIYLLVGFLLWKFTDANLPFRDSLTTTFGLIAQWMTAKKILESWLLWLIVNLIYLSMFAIMGLWFTFAYFIFLTVISMLGYLAWRKSMLGGNRTTAEIAEDAE
jgi:nicotinamide mononucleotide transporter